MKPKYRELIKVVALCAAGVLVILGIFAFVDYVWNGTFVDWFTRNYMRETGSVYAGKDVIIREPSWPDKDVIIREPSWPDKDVIIREPSWPELKKLIFTVLAVSIVFWIAVVFAVSHFYAKSREKKTVTAISQEIQSYMQANEDRPQSRSSRSPVQQALISLTQEIISTASQYVFGRCFAENWMVLEL